MFTIDVDTEAGPGRLTVSEAADPRGLLLLGHGAGGGIETPDLTALASSLPERGVCVVRYEQPWRVAGRRVAGPAASLDRGWLPAVAAVAERFEGVPLVVGGRSAGARVACRCFDSPAVGVVALSFPLHPPGRPEKSRAAELAAVPAPVLLVSGDRDPFGSQAELEDAVAVGQTGPRSLVLVPGATHSFPKRTSKRDAPAVVVAAVSAFLAGLFA